MTDLGMFVETAYNGKESPVFLITAHFYSCLHSLLSPKWQWRSRSHTFKKTPPHFFYLRARASVDKITETLNNAKHLRGEQRHTLLWKQIQACFRCCHRLKLCLLKRKISSLKDEGGGNLLCMLRSKNSHKGSLMFRSFHFSRGQVLCSLHQILLLCAQALDKCGFWKAALPYIQTPYAEGHNLQVFQESATKGAGSI